MNEGIIQQEILLIATTTFLNRQYLKRGQFKHSQAEQVGKICLDNSLDELLPEVVQRSPTGEKLLCCRMHQNEAYIHIELCNLPMLVEKELSIDSSSFLASVCYN